MNQEEIKENVRAYIKNVLGENIFSEINNDSSLIDSRLIDSVNTLQLVTHLEEQFGVDISAHEITGDNFDTINKIVGFVISKKA
jgi:D-alanine--poly(phosphoribitol) ligase subunit 2